MSGCTRILYLSLACAAFCGRVDGAQSLVLASPAARLDPSRILHIPKVPAPPILADFLSGEPLDREGRITDFRQREPNDGSPVSRATTAYVSYDDRNLYAVFVCHEEAGRVRARPARRDDIGADDQVSLFLDTYRDGQRAYVFEVNPLGVQNDGVYTEGKGKDGSFDTLWTSEGQVTPFGFVVRMTIPFSSLRFSGASAQTWGVGLGRSIVHNGDQSYWPAISLTKETFVGQLADLTGIEGISPIQKFQVVPYGTFASARVLDRDQAVYGTQRDRRAGLDLKIGIRNAFALDAIVNPDFSQVESDDPQVLINQRFEVYRAEKRPFFLENAAFFETPIILFFSRRIVDPEVGTRFTGRAVGWTAGALATNDRAVGGAGDTSGGDDTRARIGVLRAQREFSNQSRIGAFASTREISGAWNRTVSLDTRVRLSPNVLLTGQAAWSDSRDGGSAPLSGTAYYADLRHRGKHVSYNTTYTDRSQDFRSDLGFIPRLDIRKLDQAIGYYFRPKHPRIIGFGPSVAGTVTHDQAGRLQDWYVGPFFSMDFTGRTGITLSRFEYYQLYRDQPLRTGRTAATFSTSVVKWLDLYVSVEEGTDVNYNPAPGLHAFAGDALNASLQLTFRPTARVRWRNVYYRNRLQTEQRSARLERVFDNHILRSRIDYQITRQLTSRTILDYNGVTANGSLAAQESSKRLTIDTLLTEQINAGTALYLGYTNQIENVMLGDVKGPSVIATDALAASTSAQLFAKISYLFRF